MLYFHQFTSNWSQCSNMNNGRVNEHIENINFFSILYSPQVSQLLQGLKAVPILFDFRKQGKKYVAREWPRGNPRGILFALQRAWTCTIDKKNGLGTKTNIESWACVFAGAAILGRSARRKKCSVFSLNSSFCWSRSVFFLWEKNCVLLYL